jgi:hypothetical protein
MHGVQELHINKIIVLSKHRWYNIINTRQLLNQSVIQDKELQQSVKDEDSVIKKVTEDYKSYHEYARQYYHSHWENAYNHYNNKRITLKQSYRGIANNFDPMAYSTIETLVASMFANDIELEYEPPENANEQADVKTLNARVADFAETDNWAEKFAEWGRSSVLYGTGVIHLYWDNDTPKLLNIPIFDFFIDPASGHGRIPRFAGRRYLSTLEELREYEMLDPRTGNMKKRFNIPNELTEAGKRNDDDKTTRERLEGLQSGGSKDKKSKNVEVIEYWTKEKVHTILNRTTLIASIDNPHASRAKALGFVVKNPIPFVVQRNNGSDGLLFGKSELAPVIDQQELLCDLGNQYVDAITLAVQPNYTLDPEYADWIGKIHLGVPNAIYPFAASSLQQVNKAQVPTNILTERMNIRSIIRETTASNEIVRGAPASGGTTATEINAQLEQSGQRFAMKVKSIERDGLKVFGDMLFDLMKLYDDEPKRVKVMTPQGVQYKPFNIGFYTGNYISKPRLAVTVQSENNKDKKELLQGYQMLIADPSNNVRAIKERLLPKILDFLTSEDVQAIITPEQEQMQAEPVQEQLESLNQGGNYGQQPQY